MMIADRFLAVYGAEPQVSVFTPGRVNLIGEHTDYNGGMVLPVAITLGLDIALSPRSDERIQIHSDKFDVTAQRSLPDAAQEHWSDYVTGAVILAYQCGLLSGGADICIQTNLPFGAGLSSSAAVTVGVLKAARSLSGAKMSDTQIAQLARRVENEFIGVPCGIMDQMAVAISQPGLALALDTQTLQYETINLPRDYSMAVIHSGVFRQLNEGRYKIRKEECDAIKTFLGQSTICDISEASFQTLSELPQILQRRAKHCVSEHRRTVNAAAHLKRGNLEAFGALMIESHSSMRDDFEITVPAIDALVTDAVKLGASGARMTGGGFGGCIVACVKSERCEAWAEALLQKHPNAFWVC